MEETEVLWEVEDVLIVQVKYDVNTVHQIL